jgi:dipeptidyl-peptidase 4
MRKLIFAAGLLLTAPLGLLLAQDSRLTLEVLYHPQEKKNLAGSSLPRYEWSSDGEALLRFGEKNSIVRVDPVTGGTETLISTDSLTEAFLRLPGFDQARASRAAAGAELSLDRNETGVLLSWGSDLYHFNLAEGRVRQVTSDPASEEVPELSPDGRLAAFVRTGNLVVAAVDGDRTRALTTDGGPDLLNGKLDWVYQEEIYGRGQFRGFWWSPDSTRLAFLQLNIGEVPKFTIFRGADPYQELENSAYPKAGAPNPVARVGIASVADGEINWVDLDSYGREVLVVRADWGPRSEMLYCQVQNREQTFLDLLEVDPESGKSRQVLRESSPAWVNVLGPPHWLADESFLWESERSGFRHIYRISRDGVELKQLTAGEWEARGIPSVDEDAGVVYFTGTRDGSAEEQLYRVALDGGEVVRISRQAGIHKVEFSPGSGLYLDRWSDVRTPTRLSLHRSSGEEVRLLHDTHVSELDQYRLGEVEFFEIPARDGFQLPSMVIRPPDFDASQRYPVLIAVYSGPQSPSVLNRWGGTNSLWYHLLAQEGVVVWLCDNRSASGRGARSAWPIHRRLGELELQDLEDAAGWISRRDFVDPSRIGLYGWSYGGYMTAFALTHSRLFSAGIAGAPVTDWRFYDSIYTERYMGLPGENPEGYRSSSVVEAAENLHGELLLVHGTADDNVHPENTIELVRRLQAAGRDFEFMLYPGSRHGVRNPDQLYHLRRLMTRFLLKSLEVSD